MLMAIRATIEMTFAVARSRSQPLIELCRGSLAKASRCLRGAEPAPPFS